MPPAKKLSAEKSPTPQALCSVARQQLLHMDGLLDEVARNYLARLHREMAELTQALEIRHSSQALSKTALKDLQRLLEEISHLHINPERGRRKDLKRIDSLIGDVQAAMEKW